MADIDLVFDGVYWEKDSNNDLMPRLSPLPLADYDEVKFGVPYLEDSGTMPPGGGIAVSVFPQPGKV